MREGRAMLSLGLGLTALVAVSLLTMVDAASGASAADDNPTVVLETTAGSITIELDRAKAPETVDNFLKYVDSGFYSNTIFHRVIPGFMVQGGGFTEDMRQKPTNRPIKNEGGNGLLNRRGTLAMARTNDPNSATAQFFVNLVDNEFLDTRPGRPGYAVFAKVVDGMDAVDAIAKVPTTVKGGMTDVPSRTILIKSAARKGK